MSERDTIVGGSEVKYNGVFDMPLLYRRINEWLLRARFAPFKEVKYVERVKPFGKIIDFTWKTSKKDLDEYVLLEMEIKFLLVGLTEVEVDSQNGKLKLNKADLQITFSSWMMRNNKKDWDDKSLFKRIYERYIIRDVLERLKISLYKDTETIVDETKNFLALYRFK